MGSDYEIPPPSSLTVEHAHTPRLWLADGTPLVRQAGFTAGRGFAMQTSGTNPPLSDGVRKTIVQPVKLRPAAPKAPAKLPSTHRRGGHSKHGGKKC